MARTRNIKPGFFCNEELASLGPFAQILFAGLWCWADREGRLEDRPARIKAQVIPYHDCDVDSLLSSLANSSEKFIVRYTGSDGRKYIAINAFRKHQNPHVKEQASTIPAPDLHGTSMEVAGPCSCLLKPSPNHLSETVQAPCKYGASSDSDFDSFWSVVPSHKKTAKVKARTAYRVAIRRLAKREADPAAFLLERARAYYASPLGLTQFCNGPTPFLNQGHYDDDPEAWQRNGDEPKASVAQAPPPHIFTGRRKHARQPNDGTGQASVRPGVDAAAGEGA